MNGIVLTRERAKIVERIFEHPTDDGFCYSIYLKYPGAEVIWCDNKWEIYLALDKALNL